MVKADRNKRCETGVKVKEGVKKGGKTLWGAEKSYIPKRGLE